MATWTTPPIHATGDFLSVTDWNTIANNETFLHQAPYGQYWNTTGTAASVSGGTARVQLGGFRGNYGFVAPSSSIITIPLAGVYTVSFSVAVATSHAGGDDLTNRFNAQLNQNGNLVIESPPTPTYVANDPVSASSGVIVCNANDQITLVWTNNGPSTLSTNPSYASTYVHLAYVGQS
jgi:hypothetical protein